MHTNHSHFPDLVTFSTPPKRKTKKKIPIPKKKKYQVHFVLPTGAWSNSECPDP